MTSNEIAALAAAAALLKTFLTTLVSFAYAQRGGGAVSAAVHAVVFFTARALHTVAYSCRRQPARNLLFQLGLVTSASLCGHVVWHVAVAR